MGEHKNFIIKNTSERSAIAEHIVGMETGHTFQSNAFFFLYTRSKVVQYVVNKMEEIEVQTHKIKCDSMLLDNAEFDLNVFVSYDSKHSYS